MFCLWAVTALFVAAMSATPPVDNIPVLLPQRAHRAVRQGNGPLPQRTPETRLHNVMHHRAGRGRREVGNVDIVVSFSGSFDPAFKPSFDAAEWVWEIMLSDYAPGIVPFPIVINASFPAIDGVGLILGQVFV
jgi:hypothetical protein